MKASRRNFLFGAAAASTLVATKAVASAFPPKRCLQCEALRAMAERRHREWAERMARPPMIVAPELKNEPASILPGLITYVNTSRPAIYQASLPDLARVTCPKCARHTIVHVPPRYILTAYPAEQVLGWRSI